jgi:ABC-type tungstate transport system substrate-binding protein
MRAMPIPDGAAASAARYGLPRRVRPHCLGSRRHSVCGSNIDGVTRIMTTAIALETSKGNLGLALALSGVLITVRIGISAGVLSLTGRQDR